MNSPSNLNQAENRSATEEHLPALAELAGVIWRQHYPGGWKARAFALAAWEQFAGLCRSWASPFGKRKPPATPVRVSLCQLCASALNSG